MHCVFPPYWQWHGRGSGKDGFRLAVGGLRSWGLGFIQQGHNRGRQSEGQWQGQWSVVSKCSSLLSFSLFPLRTGIRLRALGWSRGWGFIQQGHNRGRQIAFAGLGHFLRASFVVQYIYLILQDIFNARAGLDRFYAAFVPLTFRFYFAFVPLAFRLYLGLGPGAGRALGLAGGGRGRQKIRECQLPGCGRGRGVLGSKGIGEVFFQIIQIKKMIGVAVRAG